MTTHHPTAPTRYTVDTGYLFQHSAKLTEPGREVVRRHVPGRREKVVTVVQVPSLWKQMEDRIEADTAGGASGKAGPGSRAPINLVITSLMDEISRDVVRALLASNQRTHWRSTHPELSTTRPPGPARPALVQQRIAPGLTTVEPALAGQLLEQTQRRIADVVARASARELDTEANLRALAAYLADGYTPQDVVKDWERRYRGWVTQAQTALALEREETAVVQMPVKGVPCPHCLTTAVIRYDEDGTWWDPALVAVIQDEQLLYTVCRHCGGHR